MRPDPELLIRLFELLDTVSDATPAGGSVFGLRVEVDAEALSTLQDYIVQVYGEDP